MSNNSKQKHLNGTLGTHDSSKGTIFKNKIVIKSGTLIAHKKQPNESQRNWIDMSYNNMLKMTRQSATVC